MKRPLIINFKNYVEISAEKTIQLANTAQKIADKLEAEVVLAPPQPSIAIVIQNVKIPVLCQHVDDAKMGSTTGFFIPEMAKSYGAAGSLINHSEHRLDYKTINNLVQRLFQLNMTSIVCARTPYEVEEIAKFSPNFIAIEPPELIGSGKAVSKEKPFIIIDSLKAVAKYSKSTKVICGAGIMDRNDVASAVQLGADGILVASGVVKASCWSEKISELASGFDERSDSPKIK
ncbi:MAG TPA: triose-phosphate isomerase [Nitrososphaeraceae archaeon]|nr:triose-phosphate isomerase [Nitrososphaeraceae archaeon]